MKGFYSDELIEEVRSANDIVDVISEYVQLKKSGRNYFGLCPFHNEKSPSFSVSQEKQIFHCFGCGEGGNVVTFVMKVENIPFFDALQSLAKRARIELPEDDVSEEVKQKNSLKEKLYSINTDAARFFYNNLIGPKGKAGLEYLTKRGIDSKTIKKFGLGYALDEWDALVKYLTSKGYNEDLIYKAGLSKKSKKGNYIDAFRNRVMFPIFDISSKVIAFGGRTLDGSVPKYLNSPETPVFNKSRNLYALNISKNTKSKKLIIVEGYMDVIALHQFGIDYAVASLGTALTENQARLLIKYADEIIVAYDSDNAGQNATLRNIEVLTGFDTSIKILQVTDGKDPDEFIRKHGPAKFLKLIDNSRTYIQFKFDLIRKEYNLENVDGKINFLNKVSDILAKIDNTIERDAYIKDISKETGISYDSIIAQVNKKSLKSDKPKRIFNEAAIKTTKTEVADKKLDNAEKMLIYLICCFESMYKKYSDRINIDLFSYDSNRKIASIVLERLLNEQSVEPGELIMHFSDSSEVNAVSEIFSFNVDFENVEKAVSDCMDYIESKKLEKKRKELLKLGSEIVEDDVEKQKLLDDLIRQRQYKS